MDLKDFVGDAATIFTIAVFLSGIEICRNIWRNKSTKDISPFPFLCGLISCSFWLRYGLLIDDSALIIVNTSGAILQVLYICWYCRYNVLEAFNIQLLVVLLIISFFYIFTTFCTSPENARSIAGIASCSAGVIFMASPLASVARVIESKTVETLPFPMIISTFVMATLWVWYGVLTKDTFVQVPNFLGAVLALSQLCLFVIYPNKKKYINVSMTAWSLYFRTDSNNNYCTCLNVFLSCHVPESVVLQLERLVQVSKNNHIEIWSDTFMGVFANCCYLHFVVCFIYSPPIFKHFVIKLSFSSNDFSYL